MLNKYRTVEYVLTQWGRWAYIERGLSLYYPSIEPYERMRATMGAGTALTDDEALAVDAVVSSLREGDRNVHDALALHYVAGYPNRKIGEIKGTHHRGVADWLEQGRMYVKAALTFGAPKRRNTVHMARQ